jgi:hypothetical protein
MTERIKAMSQDGEPDLGPEIERHSHRAHLAGYAVVVGLVFEIAIAVYWFEGWRSIVDVMAITLIALGVWAEIYYGNLARLAGDKQLAQYEARTAEANERATQANVRALELQMELERVRNWRTLDGRRFVQALDGKPSWRITELLHAQGTDTASLAGQICSSLLQTDWKCPRPREIREENPAFEGPELDRTLLGTWGAIPQGITVVVKEFPAPDEPHPAWTLINALEAGLPGDTYITVGVETSVRDGEIRVVVGHKI